MNKELKNKQEIIESWKPVFEVFPNLKAIPIYMWGRCYKYECAGEEFEWDVEYFCDWEYNEINYSLNWELLKQIDEKRKNKDKMFENIGCLNREECVNVYNFDDKYGKCLIITKENNVYDIMCVDCDSPE